MSKILCGKFRKFLEKYLKEKPNTRFLYILKKWNKILYDKRIAIYLRWIRNWQKTKILQEYKGRDIYALTLGKGKCFGFSFNYEYILTIWKEK